MISCLAANGREYTPWLTSHYGIQGVSKPFARGVTAPPSGVTLINDISFDRAFKTELIDI